MRKTRFALVSSLAITAGVSSAWAQTPPPATPPPAATPPDTTPAPAPTAAPPAPTPLDTPAEPMSGAAVPGPGAAGQPPPAQEPAPAPAAEEETFPAAWFRIDSDWNTLQLWAGATHMLSDSVGIATDMYVNSGTLGEFDIGPSFVAGSMYITPMVGLQVNWANWEAVAFVPQFYLTGGPDPLYMELWVQNYLYGAFDSESLGDPNYLYFRFFIDYKLSKYIGIGPQVEALLGLNDSAKPTGDTLLQLPVGLSLMLSNYGKNNVLYIFGGYETQDAMTDNHLAGRLTFVHNF